MWYENICYVFFFFKFMNILIVWKCSINKLFYKNSLKDSKRMCIGSNVISRWKNTMFYILINLLINIILLN